MQEIMAHASGADVASIKFLTAHLSLAEKRDVLFNLLRHRAVPLDQIEQIQNWLQMLSTFTALYMDITHSIWMEGRPQNSIWPVWLSHGPSAAVKPLHGIAENGKEFIEDDRDKLTYTLGDLEEISRNLENNYISFQEYAVAIGLGTSYGR